MADGGAPNDRVPSRGSRSDQALARPRTSPSKASRVAVTRNFSAVAVIVVRDSVRMRQSSRDISITYRTSCSAESGSSPAMA
ncbi:MAG: hypothetical protein OXC01_16920 [Immundisolibacterales bacterium]|nr:hypothetical protein [Immundisolibacterales bacterium]